MLVFFAPIVFGGRAFFLKDAQLVVYPVRLVLRERLLSGDLPEWLPALDLGLPFLANPSNGVVYPLSLLLLFPAPWSVGLFIVAHHVLAALGSWALARQLGMRRDSATVAALGFAIGGYMVSLTWGATYMLGLAWLPLIAWLVLRAAARRSLATAAVAGVALGLQLLAGEPQSTLLTMWLALTLVVARPTSWPNRLRGVALLAATVAIGFCVAMPQLLPTAELLPRSRRQAGIDLVQAQHWSLHPLRLFELLVPWLYGSPLRHATFLGYFMNDEGGAIHRDPWMVTPTFGGLGVILIATGLGACRARHRWWFRAVGVLTLITVAIAVGRHSPVFAWYFTMIPGATIFRYPAKFYGLVAATLPLLAAAGVEGLRGRARGGAVFVRVSAGAATLLAVLWLASGTLGDQLQALRPAVTAAQARAVVQSAVVGELALLAALVLVLLAVRRWRPRSLGPAAAIAVGVELFAQVSVAYETAPSTIYTTPPPLARALLARVPPGETPRILHALPAVQLEGFDELPGPRRAELLAENLPRDVGMNFGLHYARSYISSEEAEKWRLWESTNHRTLANVFGVHAIIASGLEGAPPDPTLVPLAGMGNPLGAAFWNTTALPYARPVPHPLLVTQHQQAVEALMAPEVGRGRTALIEVDENTPRDLARGTEGSCQRTAPPGDRIALRCALAHPGWVVVNESFHPNFRATVDGNPVSVHRANGFVMATFLPAGEHALVLEYSEPSLGIGLISALLALLVVGALVYREGRRPTSPPDPTPSAPR